MVRNDTVTDVIMEGCLDAFDEVRKELKVVPKDESMLGPLAHSGLEMVDCYRTDAGNFMRDGDFVTAFAAINYAHAWIGCFTELGLFDADPGKRLFERLPGSDSDEGSKITEEKMAKYLDITTRARKKIKIASPVRSFDRRLAMRFLETSEEFFKTAVDYRREDDFVRAFAAVNYSHAWLDGGARIGLFDVEEDDVLFTLYD